MIVPTGAVHGSFESLFFPFVLGGLGDSPSRRGQIPGPLSFLSWVTQGATWLGIHFKAVLRTPPQFTCPLFVWKPSANRQHVGADSGTIKRIFCVWLWTINPAVQRPIAVTVMCYPATTLQDKSELKNVRTPCIFTNAPFTRIHTYIHTRIHIS